MGKEFVMTYCEECFLIVSMFEYSKLQPGYIAGLCRGLWGSTVRIVVQHSRIRKMLHDSIDFRVSDLASRTLAMFLLNDGESQSGLPFKRWHKCGGKWLRSDSNNSRVSGSADRNGLC